MCLVSNIRNVLKQILVRNVWQTGISKQNIARIRAEFSGQKCCNCRFSAAWLSYQGIQRVSAHSKRNIHQDGLLAVVGERNVAQSDITRSWNSLGTLLSNRHIKQIKDLVRRCHTVHGNVEITTQKTHRQEELSRNQNDKDAFPHNEELVIYLLNCKNCTKRASAKCNHVHHGDGVELHG